MEKVDVLFIAFVILVIIISGYIIYLKAGINFLLEKVAEQHHVIEMLIDAQYKINNAQEEFNTSARKLMEKLCNKNSSTGGVKQSN